MEEKYNEYDVLVNSVYLNICAERKHIGKIVLWDFQESQDTDRLYFNVATIVADLNDENIYLNMPLIDYIKLKWKYRKSRKNLRWVTPAMKNSLPNEAKTSVYIILDFVASTFKKDMKIFKEINDAYYGWM